MKTVEQPVYNLNMTTADEALDLIARKVPALAHQAGRIKARPNQILKVKATNGLIAQALAIPDSKLTGPDRSKLAAMIQPVQDQTKAAKIPPVRISSDLMADLEAEVEATGLDLSTVVRRRLESGRYAK